MSVLVVDASVVVKWLLPHRGEDDSVQALEILRGIRSGELEMLQPTHWLIEAIAVAARISPHTVERQAVALHAMEIPVSDSLAVVHTACRLAQDLDHHLFDTLYHAVAIQADSGLLVTADERYYRKAQMEGRIELLQDFEPGLLD
jgi:predicted nucleic acid-binding protein